VSARLRDAVGAGNCRAVGVTGAALQGVVVLLGQLESCAVVGVDAVMLPSRDLLDGVAISSGGGESPTAEIAVVPNAALLFSRFWEQFLGSDRHMCIPKARRWGGGAHWLEILEPRLPPVRRLKEADVKPCL
jgi:hypothetical protein